MHGQPPNRLLPRPWNAGRQCSTCCFLTLQALPTLLEPLLAPGYNNLILSGSGGLIPPPTKCWNIDSHKSGINGSPSLFNTSSDTTGTLVSTLTLLSLPCSTFW